MTSLSEFSKRELQKIDVHKLRVLARQVGVSSPTSKNKGELIACITDIMTGNKAPDFKNINRGRRCKKDNISKEYQPIFDFSEFDNDYLVAHGSSDYSLNKQNTIISGIISKEGEKTFLRKFKFAETLDDVEIADDLVKNYELHENDVITYTKNKSGISIRAINGLSVGAKGVVILGDKKILLGKRNIAFISNVIDKKDLLFGLSNFGKVVYIPGNGSLVAPSPNILTLPLEATSDEDILNNFCSGCDIAQFYKNGSENVSLVADNFLSVMSAMQQFEPDKSEKFEKEIFAQIDNLLKNGITFVGLVPNSLKRLFGDVTTMLDNIT